MIEHWAESLQKVWGIDAQLTPLVGELDLNIKATQNDGKQFVLKVMRSGCDEKFVEMQCQAIRYIHSNNSALAVPQVILSKAGNSFETLVDEDGNARIVWVLSYLIGIDYASFTPKSPKLINHLGESIAQLHEALDGFDHPFLERDFKWNLMQAGWIDSQLSVIADSKRRALIESIMAEYQQHGETLLTLPSLAIHNDLNDYNLLVTASLGNALGNSLEHAPKISGMLDFGDMCASPRVCDIAIAGAYAMLDHAKPEVALSALVGAYHATRPLSETEIALVYPLVRARLAVSVVNSAIEAQKKPDDPYVVISEAPVWRLLENSAINHKLVPQRLRLACGFSVSEHSDSVATYLAQHVRGKCAKILDVELTNAPCISLSVESSAIPQDPFELTAAEAKRPVSLREAPSEEFVWLGYYNDPRLIYTDKAFRLGPWKASSRRTVHLGVDVFAPADMAVNAPIDSVVYVIENRTAPLDYGGMVILQHTTNFGEHFYSLYGHLNPSVCQELVEGQQLKAGEQFAVLGAQEHNGGWAPHLHLQLALSVESLGTDWPGVADPDEIELWNGLCPNPAALLNLPDEKVAHTPINEAQVKQAREKDFASNLKLSYAQPLMLLRGWKHYLFDQWGRPYLDAYNNVPHVGHAHPRMQSVVSEQLKRLNTNTRYFHPAQTALSQKILSKMPENLSVCYFVNSGSEANELALRLSRAHTGGKDVVTPDHGYHGNTTGAIDISAYKFNAPGGVGKPDWVWLVDIPDSYGGQFRQPNDDCANAYANQVDDAIAGIANAGGTLACFIAETFPSVGGQVIPPQGYLESVYKKVRAAGGICIADEVQTGLGRLGECYFAFEQQKVVPDIVVLGKPIGNGHPIGAVVTTHEIANSFAEGPEYFSTFGGSTLSCMVAKEVLDIVDDESLQANAAKVGKLALDSLTELMHKHPVIGDVRGMGLFIGVAFVTDRTSRKPATKVASYVVNRLRENRILAGLEGPDNNVLKIRPPLTIGADDVDMFIQTLDLILSESVLNKTNG